MTLGLAYLVRVTASLSTDPTMTATKTVYIDTASPNIQIAIIDGCDRLFSVKEDFELEVMFNTNQTFVTYTWQCTDTSTGSPCFSTSY